MGNGNYNEGTSIIFLCHSGYAVLILHARKVASWCSFSLLNGEAGYTPPLRETHLPLNCLRQHSGKQHQAHLSYIYRTLKGGVLKSQNPNFKSGEISESQFQKDKIPKSQFQKGQIPKSLYFPLESQNPKLAFRALFTILPISISKSVSHGKIWTFTQFRRNIFSIHSKIT